jgi:transposase
MNRIKSLFRSRAIGCSGRDVYYRRNRKLWLSKLTEEALSLRAEFLYKQLDHLRPLRRDAKKALVKEAQLHAAFKRLCDVHGLGPVRVAQIVAAVGSAHRFRTKRQFWTYCGLAVVTRSSSDYEMVGSDLKRRTNSRKTRGLNREFNHRLKKVFKSAAVEALKEESIKEIYRRLTGKGIRSEMPLLTVARKLAAVSLAIWKSGEEFDERKLTKQAG